MLAQHILTATFRPLTQPAHFTTFTEHKMQKTEGGYLQKQQCCILPPRVPLLNGFVMDHQLITKHLILVGKTSGMGSDDNPEITSCCSKET